MIEGIVEQMMFPPNFVDYILYLLYTLLPINITHTEIKTKHKGAMRKDK
jgi:hypothetical protein